MIEEDIKQITDVKELQRLYIELNDEMGRLETDYAQAKEIIAELSIEKILNKIYTSNLLSSEELHELTEWVVIKTKK